MGYKQLALGLALSVMAMPIAGQAQERWSIATSSTGSGPYIIGSAIAEAMNKGQSGIEVSAQSSGGYNDNLSLVAQGNVNSGLTLLSELGDAWRGTGKFEAIPDAKERFEPLRRMFPVTTATLSRNARTAGWSRNCRMVFARRPVSRSRAINSSMAMGSSTSGFSHIASLPARKANRMCASWR